jgi:hypothetical protein
MMLNSRFNARISRMLVVGLLAVPTVSVATGVSAWAAGTSGRTNGCYVQWWSTAWEGKCAPATALGDYKVHVARADQTDYNGPWRRVAKNAVVTFDSGEAFRGVQAAGNYVSYRG